MGKARKIKFPDIIKKNFEILLIFFICYDFLFVIFIKKRKEYL